MYFKFHQASIKKVPNVQNALFSVLTVLFVGGMGSQHQKDPMLRGSFCCRKVAMRTVSRIVNGPKSREFSISKSWQESKVPKIEEN